MTEERTTAYRKENDPRITQAFLREVLDYDPGTGVFRWRERVPNEHYNEHACRMLNTRDAGKVAGSLAPCNYLRVQMLGSKYLLHRLAVLWMEGCWPQGEVDHIDGDPRNNRWTNLRVVPREANRRNAARRSDNTSGVTGVWRVPESGKWLAYIRYDKRLKNLGRYERFEDAVAARKAAETIYGFHENHGKRRRMTCSSSTAESLA
jgi:hypothetical protein